jgi:oligo-1,6-glucosidase
MNMYKERIALGYSHEEIMKSIYVKGRDNARTPMQWENTANGGFTTGTPWIKINPRYDEINVKAALEDPQSIFYFYQKLIALRKEMDIIIEGDFKLLLEDSSEVFAYERNWKEEQLLVLCNFSSTEVAVEDEELLTKILGSELVISNYEPDNKSILRPYEAVVLKN